MKNQLLVGILFSGVFLQVEAAQVWRAPLIKGEACIKASAKNSPNHLIGKVGCQFKGVDEKNGILFVDCRKKGKGKIIFTNSLSSCKKWKSQWSSLDGVAKAMFMELKFSK